MPPISPQALLERLVPVQGPRYASLACDIDALAEELCGREWRRAVEAAGLTQTRRKMGRQNQYFYRLQYPEFAFPSYVAIAAQPAR